MIGVPHLKPRPVHVGVDPGFSGAVAVIDLDGNFSGVWDLPTTAGEGRQKEFDTDALAALIKRIVRDPVREVHLEWPTTRPDESAESSKRFGVGLGLLEMGFTMAGCKVRRVSPNGWKGRLGLMGKAGAELESRTQAVQTAERFIGRLPASALRGVKGGLKDGRAEALLIAWEGLTRTLEGLRKQPEEVRMARLLFGGGRKRKRRGGTVL